MPKTVFATREEIMNLPTHDENGKKIDNYDKRRELYVGEITVPVKYNYYDLECIIITALEGGINYWVGKYRIDHPDGKKPESRDIATSEWAFDALRRGGSVWFKAREEEGGDEGTLTFEGLIKGLNMFVEHRVSQSKANFIEGGGLDVGNIDADDADGIIQFSTFNEWIFG